MHGLSRLPSLVSEPPFPPSLGALQQTQNGLMEFWDTEDMSLLSAGEHYMATEVQWDPTGELAGGL